MLINKIQDHDEKEGQGRMEAVVVRGETVEMVLLYYSRHCGHIPGIDLPATGRQLERLIKESGYSVKAIQKLLHLSCPQPIYRWMKGQMLPTVDHLYLLAKVFHMHMEELLVQDNGDREAVILSVNCFWSRRISAYSGRMIPNRHMPFTEGRGTAGSI